MEKQNTAQPTYFFTSLLQIVFITLKLCKVIAWSWWWVLAPTWMTAALALLIVLIVVLFKKD